MIRLVRVAPWGTIVHYALRSSVLGLEISVKASFWCLKEAPGCFVSSSSFLLIISSVITFSAHLCAGVTYSVVLHCRTYISSLIESDVSARGLFCATCMEKKYPNYGGVSRFEWRTGKRWSRTTPRTLDPKEYFRDERILVGVKKKKHSGFESVVAESRPRIVKESLGSGFIWPRWILVLQDHNSEPASRLLHVSNAEK